MQQIDSYLDSELIRRSRNWKDLQDSLVLAIPPDAMKRVVYAVIDDTTLTIFSDSPAWTSKMRFYEDEIKKVFTQRGKVVRAVQGRTVAGVELRK